MGDFFIDSKLLLCHASSSSNMMTQYLSCFTSDCVVASLQVNHLRCLHEFVEAQAAYYKQCHLHMQDLQKELAR